MVSCLGEPNTESEVASIAIDTGRVAVPGGTLFYESSGSGDAVVLLHGGNLDRRMWDAEFDSLRQSYRVVRYDARGFGKSSPPDTAFQAHEDLRILLDSLKVDSAVLIGLSLGGRIAIDFALAHPERVRKLVLAAPGISGGKFSPSGDTAWQGPARQAAERKDSIGVARAWLRSAYVRAALRDSTRARWIEGLSVDQSPFWGAMIRHGDLELPAKPPSAERLPNLAQSVLLIVGSDDTPYILDVARAIAEQAPHVQRLDLPGVGHMINMEAPVQFLAAVRAFLGR